MKRLAILAMPALMAGIAFSAACKDSPVDRPGGDSSIVDSMYSVVAGNIDLKDPKADSIRMALLYEDSIRAARADSLTRYESLTDEDFQYVADQLGIEVAAMKAVVSIEAGSEMKGFWAPGVPVINFDATMYRQFASKATSKAGDKNATVPEGLTGYAKQEWTLLTNARRKNAQGADMGTFWGMFQIGGFNYKICGCGSVEEFVEKMSYSELSQLELFAKFVEETGMVTHLKNKDWAKFARAYNGKSYAKRGYHTKMANAYKKFSKEQ